MAGRDEYYILVVLDGSGRIVGTGALVVERKFIHNLGMVGHVEDIAVARDQQGMKLGLRIMEALRGVGERVGCYKVCCSYFLRTEDWGFGLGVSERRLEGEVRMEMTMTMRMKAKMTIRYLSSVLEEWSRRIRDEEPPTNSFIRTEYT